MGCGASADDTIAKYKADPEKYAEKASRAEAKLQLLQPAANDKSHKPVAAVIISEGSVFRHYSVEDKDLLRRQHFCLATHRETGKLRACRKMVKQRVEVDRMQEQIDIMSLLDHPNILQLHEVFHDELHYYFIEDHCRGGRLLEQLADPDSSTLKLYWNEPLVAHILREVLTGLSYMHASQVCHRNMDFQRLLLLENPAEDSVRLHKGTVMIADFTLACRFQRRIHMTEDMREFVFLPGMAPECLLGRPYDELCDIWTCGVCTYLLLSGELPYKGEDPGALLHDIAHITLLPPKHDIWQNVSEKAKTILRALLTRSPEGRCSAQKALAQPWIAQGNGLHRAGSQADESRQSVDSLKSGTALDVVTKLKAFYEASQLQKKALEVIAHRLQDDEIRELGKTFLAMDANHDGVVTVKELRRGLEKIHGHNERLECEPGLQELMRIMNAHEHKYVQYTEFLAAVMDEKYYVQEGFALIAFRYFDTDGDKKITHQELLDTLSQGDANQDESDPVYKAQRKSVMSSIKKFDADGNKLIDFHEFRDMLSGHRRDSDAQIMTASQSIQTLSPGCSKKQRSGACFRCDVVCKLFFVPRKAKYYCAACALAEM